MRWVLNATIAMVALSAAWAQTPLDYNDASITKKPTLDTKASPRPVYPPDAKRKGQEGEVKLRTCIDQIGKPHSTSVVGSSGYPLLDEAALAWLTDLARFKPAEKDGGPVSVCNFQFTSVWTLEDNRPPRPSANYPKVKDLPESDRPTLLFMPKIPAIPPPQYAGRKTGRVEFGFCIDPDGKIVDMELQKTDADMELAVMAMMWLSRAKYAPGKKDGQPIGVCGVEFTHEWVTPTKPQPGAKL